MELDRLKKSSVYLMRSKVAAEDPELDKTLFKVKDDLSDTDFLNLFLDLLKSLDKDNHRKLMREVSLMKGRLGVDSLTELLEEEPVLLDKICTMAMDMLDANAPDGYTFYGKPDGTYGFWPD
jgi:hypothetical protein